MGSDSPTQSDRISWLSTAIGREVKKQKLIRDATTLISEWIYKNRERERDRGGRKREREKHLSPGRTFFWLAYESANATGSIKKHTLPLTLSLSLLLSLSLTLSHFPSLGFIALCLWKLVSSFNLSQNLYTICASISLPLSLYLSPSFDNLESMPKFCQIIVENIYIARTVRKKIINIFAGQISGEVGRRKKSIESEKATKVGDYKYLNKLVKVKSDINLIVVHSRGK